jgi:membrane fusion protein, multidrug efflux system
LQVMSDYTLPLADAPTLTPMHRVSAATRLRVSMERLRRRFLLWVGAPVAVVLIACGGTYYWTSARFVVSTDDAYVQADSTTVAARVSGYVSAVTIEDHQSVTAGQVLAQIDARDFRAALDQARADVRADQAAVEDLEAQIAEQSTLIARAHAGVAASQAALDLANLNRVRYRKMAGIGFGSQQQSQEAEAQAQERSANLAGDRAALSSARDQVGVLQAKLAQAQALRDRSQAVEHRAALELGYTTIVAPIDGVVAARTVRLGQYVQAGTQLTAVVPLREVYIMANFKETQLTRVRPGEPVRVRVDTFPDVALHACVDSIAPASGLEFSLLPPDNATGNFTKIVQRVPVKIRLDSSRSLLGQLRPGMSVETSIDTKSAERPGACRAPQR